MGIDNGTGTGIEIDIDALPDGDPGATHRAFDEPSITSDLTPAPLLIPPEPTDSRPQLPARKPTSLTRTPSIAPQRLPHPAASPSTVQNSPSTPATRGASVRRTTTAPIPGSKSEAKLHATTPTPDSIPERNLPVPPFSTPEERTGDTSAAVTAVFAALTSDLLPEHPTTSMGSPSNPAAVSVEFVTGTDTSPGDSAQRTIVRKSPPGQGGDKEGAGIFANPLIANGRRTAIIDRTRPEPPRPDSIAAPLSTPFPPISLQTPNIVDPIEGADEEADPVEITGSDVLDLSAEDLEAENNEELISNFKKAYKSGDDAKMLATYKTLSERGIDPTKGYILKIWLAHKLRSTPDETRTEALTIMEVSDPEHNPIPNSALILTLSEENADSTTVLNSDYYYTQALVCEAGFLELVSLISKIEHAEKIYHRDEDSLLSPDTLNKYPNEKANLEMILDAAKRLKKELPRFKDQKDTLITPEFLLAFDKVQASLLALSGKTEEAKQVIGEAIRNIKSDDEKITDTAAELLKLKADILISEGTETHDPTKLREAISACRIAITSLNRRKPPIYFALLQTIIKAISLSIKLGAGNDEDIQTLKSCIRRISQGWDNPNFNQPVGKRIYEIADLGALLTTLPLELKDADWFNIENISAAVLYASTTVSDLISDRKQSALAQLLRLAFQKVVLATTERQSTNGK